MILTYMYQMEWDITPLIFLNRASITGLDKGLDLINPISYSFYGGSLSLFSLFILLILTEFTFPAKSITLLLGFLLGAVNLFLGNSRGPFIFTLIGIASILYFYIKLGKLSKITISRLLFLISFAITIIFISRYISSNSFEFGIFDRLTETKEIIETGQQDDRTILFREALDMFYEQPIYGNQLNLKSLTYPHNIFLEILMSLGIIGFLIFIYIILLIILLFYNSPKRSKLFSIWIPFSILVFGISMTTGNIYQNVIFWNLIGMLLAWPKKNIEKDKLYFNIS